MTKEEKMLLAIAQLSQKLHGSWEEPVPSAQVIQGMSLTPHSFWNMFNGMARANFLRKNGQDQVWVTPHGMTLVEELLPKKASK